jgi:hypothetical protein
MTSGFGIELENRFITTSNLAASEKLAKIIA